MQNEKVEFVAAHARLVEDFESLDNAHKALTSEHDLLTKSHDQLQTRLSNLHKPSTFTPSNDHAIVVENVARVKFVPSMATTVKTSLDKGKKALATPLHEQVTHKGKEGLGYVAKKNKKTKKKAKPALAKKDDIASGSVTRGTPTRDDFAGMSNPNYALYVDYYGDVYARYIGPFDGYIEYAIWVPKTLVANQKAPIAKWVPKSKN